MTATRAPSVASSTSAPPDFAHACAKALSVAKAQAQAAGAPFTLASVAAIIRLHCAPKKARGAAKAAKAKDATPPPPRPRDALFDGLAQACGYDLRSITPSAAKQVGMAKAEILAASPDVTPEEMTLRAQAYRRRYKDAPCTPMALAKHWPEFGSTKPGKNRPSVSMEPPAGWREAAARRWPDAKEWITPHDFATMTWREISSSLYADIWRLFQQ